VIVVLQTIMAHHVKRFALLAPLAQVMVYVTQTMVLAHVTVQILLVIGHQQTVARALKITLVQLA